MAQRFEHEEYRGEKAAIALDFPLDNAHQKLIDGYEGVSMRYLSSMDPILLSEGTIRTK